MFQIVTLGYRESVNLAQIRTFTEMDSHEERVFMQIKEAQEKAAKDTMAEKAKELKRQQREALTRGLKPGGYLVFIFYINTVFRFQLFFCFCNFLIFNSTYSCSRARRC